ncbi:GyrI-like domain-containing protein [Maribacter sp. R77961]|uniref:GyrI-like domain-containing protein n=1 Tax=Maribacter sp. R77961 TaxID=3093871 RepID=UPI0037C78DC7
MITPRIIRLEEKKLIGQSRVMSVVNNQTGKLWGSFMPRRTEIVHRIGINFFSLQVYPPDYHLNFNPTAEFTKWALVEVKNLDHIPEGMQWFILKAGDYAVFDYKGTSGDPSIFEYIYGEWILKSEYVLDDRPHFEVLEANYKNNDPDSEEEIWIPIKKR